MPVDLGFVAVLLALAAIPLLVWRGTPGARGPGYVVGYWAVWLLVAGLWLVIQRGATRRRDDGAGQSEWIRTGVEAALLGALTWVTFLVPMRRHFWGGFDEGASLADDMRVWSSGWDAKIGRPLLGLAPVLSLALTPDRIEGFLWLAAALCLANGLLVGAIIRRVMPGGTLVAAAAAALFIANRAEPLRFFPLWATIYYWLALFWLLLAFWLVLL